LRKPKAGEKVLKITANVKAGGEYYKKGQRVILDVETANVIIDAGCGE
jgi:hypothetical protein